MIFCVLRWTWSFVFVFVFVFVCIYVLCFCAATDFSANKDLYLYIVTGVGAASRIDIITRATLCYRSCSCRPMSVCVCLPHAVVVSKRLNESSRMTWMCFDLSYAVLLENSGIAENEGASVWNYVPTSGVQCDKLATSLKMLAIADFLTLASLLHRASTSVHNTKRVRKRVVRVHLLYIG